MAWNGSVDLIVISGRRLQTKLCKSNEAFQVSFLLVDISITLTISA